MTSIRLLSMVQTATTTCVQDGQVRVNAMKNAPTRNAKICKDVTMIVNIVHPELIKTDFGYAKIGWS